MITPVKELEKTGPNLEFSSLPNLEEAWNLYFASAGISDSHQGMIATVFWNGLWKLVDFVLTAKYQLMPEVEMGKIPQALGYLVLKASFCKILKH